MSATPAILGPEERIRVDSFLNGDVLDSMASDVRDGLTRPFKELPPKYFYDARGSELFDRITELPEYYQTRTERSILNARAPEIVSRIAARELVELGSGSASKTRAVLFAMAGAGSLERYVPVDVSESVVERSARELVEVFPGLEVHGLVGDFERHLEHLPPGERRLFAFLGGTIGNFPPDRRGLFLAMLADRLGSTDHLLLGVDLVKDVDVLEAAYNDEAGVTAEFNRNLLVAINRELGADFRPGAFEHVAFFEPESSWIEMRLRATCDQAISIPGAGLAVRFAEGEEMRTEVSAKFTAAGLEAELLDAGFRVEDFFTDPDGLFGLALAIPVV